MVTHLIFNSEAEANSLNSRVSFDLSPTWTDGITDNYCNPVKHPELNKWAVIIDPAYNEYFTANEITQSVELTADWTPIQTL